MIVAIGEKRDGGEGIIIGLSEEDLAELRKGSVRIKVPHADSLPGSNG